MSAPTTRRDMLRLGTSAAAYAAGAALVTGAVAIASEAKGATGVSPALLALIGAVERDEARSKAYGKAVFDPAWERWNRARIAVPAVQVAGYNGQVWSTDDTLRLKNARSWVAHDRKLVTEDQRQHFAAMKRLVAASDEWQAKVDRLGNKAAIDAAWAQDEANGAALAEAMDAVEAFSPVSFADLAAKLDFLVPRGWLANEGAPEQLCADVRRLARGAA